MTQVKSFAGQKDRLARALSNVKYAVNRGYDFTREDMLRLRQMSRAGHTIREAYEETNFPIAFNTFYNRTKSLGIIFPRPNELTHEQRQARYYKRIQKKRSTSVDNSP